MRVTGAETRIIPPLVFMGWLVAGLVLNRVYALALPSWVRGPGWVLIVAGVALMTWAFVLMRRAGTTVIPWEEVAAIITTGPFGFSRNPIYLADTLVYAGISLAAATWAPLLLLPVPVTVVTLWVIRREETYLAGRFGAPYRAYRERVRRWL